MKNLLKVNEKKNSGVLRLNQIIFKLLTISKRFQFNCLQIQRLLAIVTLFHISHHLRYYIIN